MTTYLVSGATGFVGSALTHRLLQDAAARARSGQEPHEVRVLARDESAVRRWAGSGALAQIASLADPAAIARAAVGASVIFHCASESSHRASPDALAWINVAATENVLNAARHAGVQRVVQLSCADVTLANRDRMNWNERQTLLGHPLDACARSKLLAEELALGSSDRQLQVTALRPAWVWGPDERRVLPALCAEALAGRVSLCGSGQNLVAAVYIDNLIDALHAAASAPDAPGRSYHVADRDIWTAAELYGQLCDALGLPRPARGIYALSYAAAWLRERTHGNGLWRTEVVRRGRGCLLDVQAAARDLGYEPTVSTAQGMQLLAAWAKKIGGPAAIARTARVPAGKAEVEALVQAANAAESSADV
ncbi:MAG TPA: NAD-dependent epimerase/dehydratase family protein [Polyangiales bacterium]